MIDGYMEVPEVKYFSCTGCAFWGVEKNVCNHPAYMKYSIGCHTRQVIYKLKANFNKEA